MCNFSFSESVTSNVEDYPTFWQTLQKLCIFLSLIQDRQHVESLTIRFDYADCWSGAVGCYPKLTFLDATTQL